MLDSRALRASVAALALSLGGCDPAPEGEPDANPARLDAFVDPALDAGAARPDAAVEVELDAAALDAWVDPALDASLDGASLPDAPVEPPPDATADAARSGAGWVLERVADINGANVAITVDATGRPHLSFDDADAATYSVRYATRDASGWRLELASGADDATLDSDIAVDGTGRPCIAYFTRGSEPKVSCRAPAGSWSIEHVGTYASAPFAITMTAAGVPSFAFLGADGLAYATRAGGAWTVATAIPTFRLARFLRMELDGAAAPQVIYGETAGATLTLAEGAPAWTPRVLETLGGVRMIDDADLAFDTSGRRHVVYTVPSVAVREVRYLDPATTTASVVEAVAADVLSLGIEPSGVPHVTYRAEVGGRTVLRHAALVAGAWQRESVVERNAIPALAVGPDGRLHIAYRDGETSLHSVWYATRLP